MLDSIESRLVRVGRHLKRVFGNEQAMDKALKEATSTIDKNGNISVDDLKQFVLTHCKEQIAHKQFFKKDIEAFLSAFNYNAYGATNVDSVAHVVFTDGNYVAKQLSRKTRANPPPDEVNSEMLSQIEVPATPSDHGPVDYKKAASVLKEIEEKVYCGGLPKGGTYQTVFRQIFDCDGDGFVSHADFESACRRLQIKADPSSVLNAIKALDTNMKGYFDFTSFSKKLQPGVSDRVAALESGFDRTQLLVMPEVGKTKESLSNIIKTADIV